MVRSAARSLLRTAAPIRTLPSASSSTRSYGRCEISMSSFGLAQHSDGRTDLSRGTVAALEGVVFDERLLQRVQVLTTGKPLDRDDLGILMRDGEGKAAVHATTIKQHSTGATLPVVAAFLRTSELKVLAKRIKERGSGINGNLVGCSIHLEGNGIIHRWCFSL